MLRLQPSGSGTQVLQLTAEPKVFVKPAEPVVKVDPFVGEGHRVGGPEKKDNVLVLLGGLEAVGKVEDLSVRLVCLEALSTVAGNILAQPNVQKFRSFSNTGKLYMNISACPEGRDLLGKIGFKEDGNGRVVLPDGVNIPPAFMQVLSTLKGAALMEKGALETAAAALAAKAEADVAAVNAAAQRAANAAANAAARAAAANKEKKAAAAAANAEQQRLERIAKLKRAEQERAAQEQAKQEAVIRAIAEASEASALAAKQKLAQAEAELQRQRAESERQRVEAEQMRVEAQRQRAEAATKEKAEKNRVRREEETKQQEAAQRVLAEKREAARLAMVQQRAEEAAAENARLNAERLALAARVGSNALWGAGKLASGLVNVLGTTASVLGSGISLVAQGVAEAAKAAPDWPSGDPHGGPPGGNNSSNENNAPVRRTVRAGPVREFHPAEAEPPAPKKRTKNGPSVRRVMNAERKTRKQVRNSHPEMYGLFEGNNFRKNVMGGAYKKKGSKKYTYKY